MKNLLLLFLGLALVAPALAQTPVTVITIPVTATASGGQQLPATVIERPSGYASVGYTVSQTSEAYDFTVSFLFTNDRTSGTYTEWTTAVSCSPALVSTVAVTATTATTMAGGFDVQLFKARAAKVKIVNNARAPLQIRTLTVYK
jgi:polyisoprenoid-binding protein YceI